MLGVPYSRISSAEQRSGLGLLRQQADPGVYCEARGWALYDGPGYSDAGMSAFGGANLAEGALGRFIEDLKGGRFGSEPVALLLEDLDRFSRQFPLAVLPVLVDDLLNTGTTIAVMAKGRDISRATIKANPMELHELLFWLNASHEFSEKLSHRIAHVHQNHRRRIRDGEAVNPDAAPAWIDLKDGQWVLNDYAKVIHRLLALSSDHGLSVVAATLNREGHPSPGQYRRNRWAADEKRRTKDCYKQVLWSSASVRSVLQSPALTGKRQVMSPGHKTLVRQWKEDCVIRLRQGARKEDLPPHPQRTFETPQANYYPALLSEQEHAALMSVAKRRLPVNVGRTEQLNWLAQGFTFCSHCGDLIGASCSHRKRPNGRKDVVYSLRCKGRHKGNGCTAPTLPLRDVEASLLTRLSSRSLLEMLRSGSEGDNDSELSAMLAARDAAQNNVDQATTALAVGEQAMAAEGDPAVLRILARRQVQQELTLAEAQQALALALADLQRHQCKRPIAAIGDEAQEEIRKLLSTFARMEDTVDDRRLVRTHLLRMGMQLLLDTDAKLLGLRIADGPFHWQPLAPMARRLALEDGMPSGVAIDLPGGIAVALAEGYEITPDEALGMFSDTPDPEGLTLELIEAQWEATDPEIVERLSQHYDRRPKQ